MKKLLCLLLCLLLLPIALPVVSADDADTVVRVLLSTNGADTLKVTLSGQYAVGDKTVTGGTVTAKISDGKITVSHSSAGTLASTKTSATLRRAGTDANTILTFDNAKHGTRKYYGDFVFYNDNGTLRLINYVDMHNYLYGVVSGEMSDSSKPDVLKTEAICAKGFALAEVEARQSKYFDVYDTTTSQLYYGFIATDTNTIAAVDAVWRQTLRYNGKTVKTYYSTANGGQAITPRIRWGGTENAGAYWFGYDPFDLLGSTKNVVLEIDGANPKGMNSALYTFLCGKANAKEIVSVDMLVGVYDPDNPSGTARYPSALAPQKRYDWKLTVRTNDGSTKQVTFSCAPDEVKAAAAPSATGAVCFAVHTAKTQWKLVWGVSSGHRAGLSHRGTIQMVKKGYSYVDVLKFYYRGATLYDETGAAIVSDAIFDFTYEDGATPLPTVSPSATPSASPSPTPSASPSAAPTPTPSGPPPETEYDVIVTSTTQQLREKPDAGSASKKQLTLGSILGVTGQSGDWLAVYDWASGLSGYVHGDCVSYYEREPKPHWEGVCNADDSNLRAGPSTNFAKYRPLNTGDKVWVYYASKNWYYVMDRRLGQGGFIFKNYITLGDPAPEVLWGDTNGTGSVTTADAALILRWLIGTSSLYDAALLAADCAQNGTVNAEDAAAILRYLVGLE